MGIRQHIKKFILDKTGMKTLLKNCENTSKNEKEILAAITFTNAIQQSEWLKDKSFFPGGWAVEYTFLLNLYRVLNHHQFKNILEFGLGQTSRMIHQYANFYKVHATTVEHDEEWAKFTKKDTKEAYPINVKLLSLETIDYKGFSTRTYKNIEKEFHNQKFDFILVDGPFGSDHYSRSQIIQLAENNLAETFCIIIDDCGRNGEKETLEEIKKNMRKKGIEAFSTIYYGKSDFALLCSKNLHFLTSL